MVQRACHPLLHAHCAASRVAASVLLAPAWHTRVLVALLLSVATTGLLLEPASLQPFAVTSVVTRAYAPLVLVNVMLCLYVSGVGLERNVLGELLGRFRGDGRRLLEDLGIGLALAVALIAAENGLQAWLGMPESIAAHALRPGSTAEKLAWLPVAAVVGFSEEVVYRGYLQRQFTALSGWLPFGVLVQAALFGIAHAEQGGWAVGRFAGYALVLGTVAAWRRSLVPGILCHVVVDSLAAWEG